MNIAKVRGLVQDNKNRLITAGVVAASGAGVASAQSTAEGINYSTMVSAVQTGMTSTINSAGPALFGFVAVIGGFYFVWGRIRSLW